MGRGNLSDSLSIYDISDPTNPTLVNVTIDAVNMNNAERLIVDGDIVYVLATIAETLTAWNVSNKSSPSLISTYSIGRSFCYWGLKSFTLP